MAEAPTEKKIPGHVIYGGGDAVYFDPRRQVGAVPRPRRTGRGRCAAAQGYAEVAGFGFDPSSALGNLPRRQSWRQSRLNGPSKGWHASSMTTKSVVAFSLVSTQG